MNTGAAPASGGVEAARTLPEGARRSHALEHLTGILTRSAPLQVIDLGGISQPTLEFVTSQGHRLYAENLIRAAEAVWPAASWFDQPLDERPLEEFLSQAIPFPEASVGAALLWDQFHFLPPALAQAVAARLRRVLKPDAPLLSFFYPESARTQAPVQACRILDERHLQLIPRGAPRRLQTFTPRTIERFFHEFHSVKFFMTRESTQEVVVRR